MTSPKISPYGSWLSPFKASLLASAGVGLGTPWIDGTDVYWLETRPLEKGRAALVRYTSDGQVVDAIPGEFNVRTTVHEYGGGAYVVHQGEIYFSHFADQRLYRYLPGGMPTPITPEPETPRGARYADGRLTPDGQWIICVRERHLPGAEAINELVILPADGSAAPRILTGGYDFYAAPRLSPDGTHLAWLCWNHPNMPWDGCELWLADFSPAGDLGTPRCIAGGPDEAICQPEWSPRGVLHFVSDRTGWWNLYRWQEKGLPLAPMEAEFGMPQWSFGNSNYTFLPGGEIACIYTQHGRHHLGVIPAQGGAPTPLALDFTVMFGLKCDGERLWLTAASPTSPTVILAVAPHSGQAEVIRRSASLAFDAAYFSMPRPIEFPTENGLRAHAFYYPPVNPDFRAPVGEKPPLIVIGHGGPTGCTYAQLSLGTQYWTSRGFGVVDVNYGGSAGYGRAYRQRLNGNWGVVDVMDCIHAARYLAGCGEVDPQRIAIRGGSAGGYTTLCGLAYHKFFAAGASYFGVADLIALDQDTHKFESHYNHTLIGPYPEKKELYIQRSPVHYAHQISCPVIIFQGLEDKVVPPSQSEAIVAALAANGLPHAYLSFEGEQHGFRKAETIQRAAEAEWYFYSRIFHFDLPEDIQPVKIENAATL